MVQHFNGLLTWLIMGKKKNYYHGSGFGWWRSLTSCLHCTARACVSTSTRARCCHPLCVHRGLREGIITVNTHKSPGFASSLLGVPSCDKPAAYRRLTNIKLSSLWQGLLKKDAEGSRGPNQVAAQIICRRRAAAVSGTPSNGWSEGMRKWKMW